MQARTAARELALILFSQFDKEISQYKTKEFDLVPMAIEDAIENMEMLGHEFYVFLNAKSKKFNILYTRRDCDLGVIECNY